MKKIFTLILFFSHLSAFSYTNIECRSPNFKMKTQLNGLPIGRSDLDPQSGPYVKMEYSLELQDLLLSKGIDLSPRIDSSKAISENLLDTYQVYYTLDNNYSISVNPDTKMVKISSVLDHSNKVEIDLGNSDCSSFEAGWPTRN